MVNLGCLFMKTAQAGPPPPHPHLHFDVINGNNGIFFSFFHAMI